MNHKLKGKYVSISCRIILYLLKIKYYIISKITNSRCLCKLVYNNTFLHNLLFCSAIKMMKDYLIRKEPNKSQFIMC